jgi:hypothetical protein
MFVALPRLYRAPLPRCKTRGTYPVQDRFRDTKSLFVPQYFDPQYGCQMEALALDSNQSLPGLQRQVNAICNQLLQVPVYCSLDPLAGGFGRSSPTMS